MDVSAAFPPELAAFGRSLLPPEAGAVPLPSLLEGMRGQERPWLSMWSQRYLLVLVPPLLAAALCTDRAPQLALDAAAVLIGPDDMPRAACLPGLDRSGRADLPGSLLRHHLIPLAARLAAVGLPAPVTWSNAGYVISWTLRTLRLPGAAELLLLLQSPFWSGGPNPLPAPVRAVLGNGGRNACCLRFRLPDVPRCPECPGICRSRPLPFNP